MDRLRTFGYAGCGAVAVVAVLVLGLNLRIVGPTPPGDAIRGVVLAVVLGAPGVVGWIGVRSRLRPVLVAAAAGALAVAWISIATLILVVAAALFLGAATGGNASTATGERPGRWRPWLLVPAAALLGLGSILGPLTTTEERCWAAYERLGGGYDYRDITPAEAGGPIGGPGLPVAAGCGSGSISTLGALVGVGLAGSSIGLAFVTGRPRRGTERPAT